MNITLRKVGLEYVDTVQQILQSAPIFFIKTEGDEMPSESAAKDAMTDLPPNTEPEKKHFLLFFDEKNIPFAVCDLILGYPNEETAFLGLLLLDEKFQNRSLGTTCFNLIQDYIKNFPEINKMQLGFVERNPVEGFWRKMGFERNGRSRPYSGKFVESTVFVMEKSL